MQAMCEWSKVLLGAYPYLPRAVEGLKEEGRRLAMSGFGYRGNLEDLMNQILDLNVRIESYLNAKVVVDEVLRVLGGERAAILRDRYIKGMTAEAVALSLNVSVRTAFRKCADALVGFAKTAKSRGYTAEWLESRYAKDALFIGLYERMKRQEKASPVIQKRRERAAIASLGKTAAAIGV